MVCTEALAPAAGSQQYRPAVSPAEAELRAMVYSVDHSDACWYYIDPQVSPVHAPAASLTNTLIRSLFLCHSFVISSSAILL